MNQLRLYKYSVVGLVLLNVAILAFFMLTKPTHPPQHEQRVDFQSEVVKILHLSAQQEELFKDMAINHHHDMEAISERQQDLLLPYFESLSDTTVAVDEDDILHTYEKLEREKITVTHQHFLEIKSILEEGQLPYFEQVTKVFIDNVLEADKKNGRPPKDFD